MLTLAQTPDHLEGIVRVPIRFSDIDSFRHVNHAKLLTYCEDHRTAMLPVLETECGTTWTDQGFVLAHLTADFLKPVTLADGEVDVAFSVVRTGRTSVTVHYELRMPVGSRAPGTPVARVEQVLVIIGPDGPRPLSANERDWFARFKRPAVAGDAETQSRLRGRDSPEQH